MPNAERRRGVVVVLDEPHQPFLVVEVRRQVIPDLIGGAVLEAVVEPLVVAVVEALLLQGPLQVPVGLGDEQESGVGARTLEITVGQ